VGKISKQKLLKLRDAIADASSALKEAGDPLLGRGINERYVIAHKRYGDAVEAMVKATCVLHVADWQWDGYENRFCFSWEFSVQLCQPGKVEYDTRYVQMSTHAQFDDSLPLDEELTRLRIESEHYDELRSAAMQWSRDVTKEPKQP
jgi:hypothetical protein